MSNTVKSKCDHCGKEVDVYSAEKGWIHFDLNVTEDGPDGFFISVITDFDKYRTSTYIRHDIDSDLDFCSLGCLGNWLIKGTPRTRKAE